LKKEGKTGPQRGYVPVEAGKVSGEGEEGQVWLMYFVHMSENRTMKLVETVLRRRDEGE
jgi:hypothetical protein